jgi:hypothetical protein
MSIIHQYAVVDNATNKVIGKYIRPFAPPKMQNIQYTMIKTDSTGTHTTEGTAFLSKAQKFWDEVSDPFYSTSPEQLRTTLMMEGFV